jgi:hypothetical protein
MRAGTKRCVRRLNTALRDAQSCNSGEPLCPIATTGAAGTNFPITRTQMYKESCQPGKLLSEEKSLVSISEKKV